MEENVFAPTGMSGSGYEKPAGKAVANGYVRDEHGYRQADASAQSVRFSAGGLFSTAPDLQRLVAALAKGKLLKNSTVDEMWIDRGNQYGYGWFVDSENRRREVGHNGRVDGYASSFRYFRDEDLFLAVLSNTQGTNTERMIQALSAITHGEPFKMPREHKFVNVPGGVLQQYVGKYKLPWGLVLVVTREGDQLFGRAEQEKKPTEWKAESATTFYVPPADIEIEFKKDGSGGYKLNFDGAAEAARVKD
jgi:CubicO group peptidase (beta-lactamase class C family)